MVRGEVFEKRAGGSELNVASGISLLGLRTGIISKLPANDLGTYIKNRCLLYTSAHAEGDQEQNAAQEEEGRFLRCLLYTSRCV